MIDYSAYTGDLTVDLEQRDKNDINNVLATRQVVYSGIDLVNILGDTPGLRGLYGGHRRR